jgi:hypothetical protein
MESMSKYRISMIEGIYFVESKFAFLPWRKRFVTTSEDQAYTKLRILTGTRKIITEVPA